MMLVINSNPLCCPRMASANSNTLWTHLLNCKKHAVGRGWGTREGNSMKIQRKPGQFNHFASLNWCPTLF
jgi:hypothetical protein